MYSRERRKEGKLTGKEQVDPRLDLVNLDVESRRDDSGLVESSVELDNDLTGSVVVDDLEVTDVSWRVGARREGENATKRKGGEARSVTALRKQGQRRHGRYVGIEETQERERDERKKKVERGGMCRPSQSLPRVEVKGAPEVV